MKNLNMKPFLSLLAGFSVIVLFLAALVQGFDLRNFLEVLRLIPTVATADGIAYFVSQLGFGAGIAFKAGLSRSPT